MSPPTTPMWLSHHEPVGYDRCVTVGHRHVCRRCLVLYPAMLVVAVVQLAGLVPSTAGVTIMWLAPLGVVAEWIGEHVGTLTYSARRQTIVTAAASLSFGIALGRHVRHPFEAAAAAPAIVFTVVCLAAWFVGARRHDPGATDWERSFEHDEARRLADLVAVLDLSGARADQPGSQTKSMSSSTAPTSDGSRSL